MARLQWKWRRKSTGELLACIRVDHHLSRNEMIDLLCAQASVEAGTRLTQKQTVQALRDALRSAPNMEIIELWGANYTDDEATERIAWAAKLVNNL